MVRVAGSHKSGGGQEMARQMFHPSIFLGEITDLRRVLGFGAECL